MGENQRVELWFCGVCGIVHLAAGTMRMDFDRAEFAEFMRMVVEMHYSGWPPDRPIDIDQGVTLRDGFFCSSVVL